ncbi:unnamed protein product [Linum trigynum]|uniref:N-acetyltransferase domain-containing protein n=1 Tax=Linum trigynum TaxID=586398 RepID=A0AAV2FEE8_9ROSI
MDPEVGNRTITLRRLKVSDVEDFMVWDGDERVTKFCDGEPCTSREEAIYFINSWSSLTRGTGQSLSTASRLVRSRCAGVPKK